MNDVNRICVVFPLIVERLDGAAERTGVILFTEMSFNGSSVGLIKLVGTDVADNSSDEAEHLMAETGVDE